MVTKYECGCSEQISQHFNVKEFKCKCGTPHEILIDTELIKMLENLYVKLECSKIVINCGHRCPAHDRTVGGSGNGQHTLGLAADIVCYGKDGKLINAKLVCCKAQDMNVPGIANISSKYQAVHLDVRQNGTYRGDEIYNYNSIKGKDFYSYWGINNSNEK